MLEQHLTQCAQLKARVSRAGRIAGAVEKKEARLGRDRRGQLPGRDLVALGDARERHHRQAIGQHHHVGIGHPVGRRDDGLIARIQHGHAQVVEGLLGAGRDQDLGALVGDAVVALEFCDDRVLEFVDAVDIGVAGEAGADGGDPGLHDVLRGIEIRLAGTQSDDVFAFGLELGGAGGDGQGRGGLDALHAPRNGLGHGISCSSLESDGRYITGLIRIPWPSSPEDNRNEQQRFELKRITSRRAISRRRSTSWSRARARAGAPDPARGHRQRQDLHVATSSSGCSARQWCWPTTRRSPRSSTANSGSSFPAMRSSTSSPITTTTSPRPTCRPPTRTSRRTPR